MTMGGWLVFRIPAYSELPGPEDSAWAHAEFVQESSPGWMGGTSARRILSRDEAFALAERMSKADREESTALQYRYYPVEVGGHFVKTIRKESDVGFLE